jgi:hypothetical protein
MVTMTRTFTLFQFLPTELRLKVWNYAFGFFTRVIELTPQGAQPEIMVRYRRWEAMASTTLTLLQVNRETRYEFLPRYSSPFNPGKIGPCHSNSLLINYETDTIYFRTGIMPYALAPTLFSHVFGKDEAEVRENLESLAGNDKFWRNMMFNHDGDRQACFRQFEHFKKLREVIVVPALEERLDGVYSSTRLKRFEECNPRGPYEAGYLPWFTDGFGSTSRSANVAIKLCQEVLKVERGAPL